jgi:hypothetical protein
VGKQRIDERPLVFEGVGVRNHAGGFIYNEQGFIFKNDSERDGLCLGKFWIRSWLDKLNLLPREELMTRGPRLHPVDVHMTSFNQALQL